jgi:hypothetical protein
MVNYYFRYSLILHTRISCPFCNGITNESNLILSLYFCNNLFAFNSTVDSRYLEFDGTMEKIRVKRSSTQEEL